MVDSLQKLCFQSQADKSVPFIGIPPRAGAQQAAQSQMLCRAAASFLLQAFQELAHHRTRGWLQRARGVTSRKIQQSHTTRKWDLSKSHETTTSLTKFFKHQVITSLADKNEQISEIYDLTSVVTCPKYFLYLSARNHKFTSSRTKQICHGKNI